MNQNNVKHMFGIIIFVHLFSLIWEKKIQVEICQDWTKLFSSQSSKFILEGFNPNVSSSLSTFPFGFRYGEFINYWVLYAQA